MHAEFQNSPFGSWPSPISAASVAAGALRFGRVQIAVGAVYWSEGRPAENGRTTVMRWQSGQGLKELLPPPFSARSRVHEYGGGEFLVSGDIIYFVNDGDQDIYAKPIADDGAGIRRLTSERDIRFADFSYDARRLRLIAVGEDHGSGKGFGHGLPSNALWCISTSGNGGKSARIFLDGRDFYANPRLSPDGSRLCFLAWDLPSMPWEAAALYVADIGEDGSPGAPVRIAGEGGSACFQPEWSADGSLYFCWDIDGYGNLFRWRAEEGMAQVTHLKAEVSKPLWSFNAASYALLPNDRIFVSFIEKGRQGCAIVDLNSSKLTPIENGLTAIANLAAEGATVGFAALTDTDPLCVCASEEIGGADAARRPPSIIRKSSEASMDRAYISEPRFIGFPNAEGETVYGIYYPPANPAVQPPEDALPPLIINLHGGPTGAATRGLKPRTLFFTSRGFAWLDLDYSGSTGYGRAYRDRLRGNWGIKDVGDTVAAAEYAAGRGLAAPDALFVTGGSAGGYTVLMAIATSNIFRGAASYYGICDLVALQRTTHKFEQGYQSGLLGATLEENEALYRERSAISHIDRIETPLILFQGAEDMVVPKEQARMIAAALRNKNLAVEYHEFEGEGHGFRRAQTIEAALQAELEFYRKLIRR